MSTKSIKSDFFTLKCFLLGQNVKQVTFFLLDVLYEHKKHENACKNFLVKKKCLDNHIYHTTVISGLGFVFHIGTSEAKRRQKHTVVLQ